jgi:putative ABC transport system ATP-binding protein
VSAAVASVETSARVERCDVCIVGAGIAGLNALFAASQYLSRDQKIIVVDRRDRVGGMWVDTYDYVRLHQPHGLFTAGNIKWTLGQDPSYLATKDEVLDHFDHCVNVIRQRVQVEEHFGWALESHDETDGNVRITCRSSDGQPMVVDAKRLIKAYGLRVAPNDPLEISSTRVQSVSPDAAAGSKHSSWCAGARRMINEMKGRPMLEMTHVTKTYRIGGQTVRALDDIELELIAGEFVSIVGPSGAGKSTLLHLLGALDRPDHGSILFQGNEISDLNDEKQSEFRRHSVGFVFQFFNLLPTMTAWENVAVPKLLDGARMSKVKSRALDLLALVGLAERAEHRPSELSGGQMQRVAVARALMMDPPLILADEPTGNLDTKTGAAIMALLTDVAHQDGRSVVMVTHNLDAASSTDRVITLTDGRIGSDVLAGESR